MDRNYGFCNIVNIKDKTSCANKLTGENCCMIVKDNFYSNYKVIIYMPISYLRDKKYTIEDLFKWLKFIRWMNFKFEYIGIDKNPRHNESTAGKNNEYHILNLYYKDYINGAHALAAYQVLRALYKNNFDGVVEECYKLKKEMPRLRNFTCLLLAYRVSPIYSPVYGLLHYSGKEGSYAHRLRYFYTPQELLISPQNYIVVEKWQKTEGLKLFHFKPVTLADFEKKITCNIINKSAVRFNNKEDYHRDGRNIIELEKLEEMIANKDYKSINNLTEDDRECAYW